LKIDFVSSISTTSVMVQFYAKRLTLVMSNVEIITDVATIRA